MRRQIERAEEACAFARRVEMVLVGVLGVPALVAADGIGTELGTAGSGEARMYQSIEGPAERIYRSCKRESVPRYVFLKPDGTFGSAPAMGSSFERLLRLETGRVVGIYDDQVDLESLLQDMLHVAKAYGVGG